MSVLKATPRLVHGPVGRNLRSLAVPMAVGFVALHSYSIVDTYFVGQLGTLPLAALGFTFPVAFSLVAVGLGVGMGVSSVLARLLGTGDRSALQRIATHALLLGAVLGLLLMVIGLNTIDPVFRLLGADERTLPLIREYMEIFYLGGVFLVLPMVGNFAIRAVGDARVPAVILTISSLINIVLDPLLIFGLLGFPRLELRGAAIATVIANGVAFIASAAILHRREHLIRLRYFSTAKLWESWRQLLHIALPASAANLVNPVTVGIITSFVAGFGPESVAGFGVASRVESVVLMVIFALSSSVGPFVGQNYGAGRLDRVSRSAHLSDLFYIAYGLSAAVVLLIFAAPLAEFFNEDPDVVAAASTYLVIVPFTYGAFGIMMGAAASFNALGKPLPATVLTFAKTFLLYVPLAWALTPILGLAGIFWANAVSHLVFGAAAFLWLRRTLAALGAQVGGPASGGGSPGGLRSADAAVPVRRAAGLRSQRSDEA